MRSRLIMKFGGSSLASAECFRKVSSIIQSRLSHNPMVVVSALGTSREQSLKVTDLLKEIATLLFQGKDADPAIKTLLKRHHEVIRGLSMGGHVLKGEEEAFAEVTGRISAGEFPREVEALDALMGFGEIFSAKIMACWLAEQGMDFQPAASGDFELVTDDNFQDAHFLPQGMEKIAARIIASKNLIVFPGYIGVTLDGRRTTLGRGGSDYTAAILGAALKRDVEIWTDVDGIYRIAPHYLPPQFNASGHPETIPVLSYEEAFQMAAFGSRVLYEKALMAVGEAVRKGKHIQLYIKNTFNPEHPGTVITSKREHTGIPRGITVLEGTQLFNVYPDSEEEVRSFFAELGAVEGVSTMLSSRTSGRLSIVMDKYHPGLSKLESGYHSHLSRDQVLIKIVGDGLGENPQMILRIHGALQSAENVEKYGMTIVQKSPQLLTDNTFEFLAKKRGLRDILMSLYKHLFMQETVNVGVMGLGVVGSGVLHYAREMYSPRKGGFSLHFPRVLVRDIGKRRDIDSEGTLTTNPADILDDPLIDVVLEVMGGIEPARTYILEAFKRGKHVVTANKALLAAHGPEIFEAAFRNRCNLGFEASVCGEIPIIDDFLKFPGLQDIRGIEGIVNGTSNYVLTRFMEGMAMQDAIKIAQQKGFAEADPTLDLSGADASQKLAILTSILFNQPVDYRTIPREGIESLRPVDRMAFQKWSFVVKPLVLAKIQGDGLTLRVSPALISEHHPLASVKEENNALALYLQGRSEPITKIGKGAGAIPTARSIVRDLMEVTRKSRSFMVDLPGFFRVSEGRPLSPAEDFETEWYARFSVVDHPGVFGRIATVLGEHSLSIRRVFQEEIPSEKNAHIVLELKKTPLGRVKGAVEEISALPFVHESFTCVIDYEF